MTEIDKDKIIQEANEKLKNQAKEIKELEKQAKEMIEIKNKELEKQAKEIEEIKKKNKDLEDQIQKLKNQIINQEDKKEKVDTKKY